MSYMEPILVHPVSRQNFGDAVAQTCNPHLIPCPTSMQVCTFEAFFPKSNMYGLTTLLSCCLFLSFAAFS